MERLTIACLQWLPSVVVFVVDLTEECGSSLRAQWNIRQTLKSRFHDKQWIDVFSKADLLDELLTKVQHAWSHLPHPLSSLQFLQTSERPLQVYHHNLIYLNPTSFWSLLGCVLALYFICKLDRRDQSKYLQAGNSGSGSFEDGSGKLSPTDFAQALPQALRISSVTEEGIDTAKQAIMQMLQAVMGPDTDGKPNETFESLKLA